MQGRSLAYIEQTSGLIWRTLTDPSSLKSKLTLSSGPRSTQPTLIPPLHSSPSTPIALLPTTRASQCTKHGEIACPKIGTGPNFIPKREIKKKCAAFSAHFFLLWSKATIFLCHMEAISWLKVTRVVCGWRNIFIIDDKYNKFSVHLLKDVRNFAGRGDHRLLWLKATTSLSCRGAISRT